MLIELGTESMLLTEIVPPLAAELEELLKKAGELELAAQVPQLRIVERCRCGDAFCASFYTQPKPEGSYGSGHDCLELEPGEGMLILDVVAGTIVHVELLYRDDIRKKLIAAFPGGMLRQDIFCMNRTTALEKRGIGG